MDAHSVIPPSSAGVWGKPDGCTGWVIMNANYPETEPSIESLEGSAAHEIAADLISLYRTAKRDIDANHYVGKTASNGTLWTLEMFDSALVYANDVLKYCDLKRVYGGNGLGVEESISCPTVHNQSHGTPDCFMYDGKELIIWDFKHGHVPVEAYENWQLINYYAGLTDHFGIDGVRDQQLIVTFRIIQPRAFHRDGIIREWKTTGANLRGYINTLKINAEIALSDKSTFNTGSHCLYCPGRHACDAALTAGTQLFEVTSKPLPIELSPQSVGVQLTIIKRALEQLKALETGYTEQVARIVKSGKVVQGWNFEPSKGRVGWDRPDVEIIEMFDQLNVDLRKPGIKTPNQAKVLGGDEEVIKMLSSNKSNGLILVKDDGIKVKQIFQEN